MPKVSFGSNRKLSGVLRRMAKQQAAKKRKRAEIKHEIERELV